MTAQFDKLLPVLVCGRIEFILIGGVAAAVHGSARVTYDVDICYSRASENIARLVHALEPHAPYLRGAPPGLLFHWDERTVARGLNFTLTTKLGDLNLIGEVIRGGGYADLLPHSIAIEAFGVEFRCIDLPTLIRLKRAAGRPRDFEALAELEVLRAAHAAE